MTVASTEAALRRFLGLLDAEDWERVVEELDEDVELADELTATWLRGRERVAAYLRAQADVVTDITSTPSDVVARALGRTHMLMTFGLRQDYRLDGEARHEQLTGSAVFRLAEHGPALTLFHLGDAARPTGDAADLDRPEAPAPAPPTLGERVRDRRDAAGLSLRALAARSGLSASFLSQLERDRVDASIGSLRRLAEALGTTAPALVGGSEVAAGLRTGRADERSRTHLLELGLSLESFPPLPGGRLQSWLGTLEPGAPPFSPVGGGAGERFVFVLEGAVAVVGGETVVLQAGDGAHVDPAAHRLAAHGTRRARFLAVQTEGR